MKIGLDFLEAGERISKLFIEKKTFYSLVFYIPKAVNFFCQCQIFFYQSHINFSKNFPLHGVD